MNNQGITKAEIAVVLFASIGIIIIVVGLISAFLDYRKKKNLKRAILIGIMSILVGQFICGLANWLWHIPPFIEVDRTMIVGS